MFTRPDLSGLTEAEKDALILALFDRLEANEREIGALKARLNEPPKTLDNSNGLTRPSTHAGRTGVLLRVPIVPV